MKHYLDCFAVNIIHSNYDIIILSVFSWDLSITITMKHFGIYNNSETLLLILGKDQLI